MRSLLYLSSLYPFRDVRGLLLPHNSLQSYPFFVYEQLVAREFSTDGALFTPDFPKDAAQFFPESRAKEKAFPT